ncbi:MAG: hypothetical protein J6L73_04120 [Muribaculaceae bacterium]|nr:hypothetical protein [Muribaculaceae bacterium]
MKHLICIVVTLLIFSSCSNNDEPAPDVFSQVAEITNGDNDIQTIAYDSYGRVAKYTINGNEEEVIATYSYPSDDIIKIHTEHITTWSKNASITRSYDDEVYLENGRAAYCEGIFSTDEFGTIVQKKYRHDFSYTGGNHLNVVKCTQWSKNGNGWNYEKPWSWENYYIWEGNNLVSIEDCAGHDKPTYIYNYSYSSVSGIQNLIPLHFGRYQYYPLQLKGYFGSASENLINGLESVAPNMPVRKVQYEYVIQKNRITGYSETRNGKSEHFSVNWTE